MGAFVGLLFATGIVMLWRGPSAPRRPARGPGARFVHRRAELLRQAGLDGVSVLHLFIAQTVSALVGALAVAILTSTLTVALCFAAFGWFLPLLAVRRLRRRRVGALRELWPEAIDHLGSAVRAGMSLPDALGMLAEHGPAPLRAPFARFAAAYRVSGRFGECLDRLKDDLCDPVADRICETLRVAREVGGSDLGLVLRTLSELVRADARTRAELETRQGWVVNGARLAVAAPWMVLLLLGSQSSTVRAYDSPGGTMLLVVGAAVCLLAYRVMLHIGRLPEERRVLQ